MTPRKTIQTIREALLDWYRQEKRDLPWRRTSDPYRILVSEIMLQQTQVKTVIPYYRRWIRSFPTVTALAAAPEARVLKHWEGLGYYSRARNLRKAARMLKREFKGKIPDTLDDLLTLPGIGRYTAGAVLSIAFDRRVPVLDGNVKRVLSRLFRLEENGGSAGSEKRLWEKAQTLVPEKHPGDFNQAIMDLGATLCVPKNPLCDPCPLHSVCGARKRGEQGRYPPAKKRTPSNKIEVSAAVIQRNGKIYIQQRLLGGLMGGLWEFPGGKIEQGESPEDCLRREIREELGVGVTIREKLMAIKHSYTQFRVTLHVYQCRLNSGRLRPVGCEAWKWVKTSNLAGYPFPAANVKIVRYLEENAGAAKTNAASRTGNTLKARGRKH